MQIKILSLKLLKFIET